MKYCSHCGNECVDDALICTNCGCSVEPTINAIKPQNNGFAIAGFVCSFFIPLLGWIFGGIGLSKSKKIGGKGQGFSIAALAIATVMFIFNLIYILS